MFILKFMLVLLGKEAKLSKTGKDATTIFSLCIATIVCGIESDIQKRRNINAFPESVVNAGADRGLTLRTTAGATWLGAGQRIICTKVLPVESTFLEPDCQSRGCEYQVMAVNESHAELYFIADKLWYGTHVGCKFLQWEWQPKDNLYLIKGHEFWAPIDVRDPPEILIQPHPTDVYRGHSLVAVCRANSSLVAAQELQLVVLGADGLRLDSSNQTVDESHDVVEIRATLQPHELQFVKYIRCDAHLGAAPDVIYRSSISPVTIRDVPKLVIVPSGATLVIGTTATIACVADGFVIGGLQWTVDCASCTFTQQSWPPSSGDTLTSAYSPTQTITFLASQQWDGITVGCQPLGYESLAMHTTLRVKQFPSLTISPPELETYDGQGVTVGCFMSGETPNESNTEQRKLKLIWSVQPQRDMRIPWISDEELEQPGYNLNFRVTTQTGETSSYVHFQSSPYWINTTVGCSLRTEDPADAKGTRISAPVSVFEPPTISIEPRRPVVEQGSDVTLLCTAYGLVFGGLQWTVDCSACEHRVQPVPFSSKSSNISISKEISDRLSKRSSASSAKKIKNARLQVVITVRDIYQSITAECGVSGTGGWPKDVVTISMPVSPIATTLRWIGVLLAAAVIATVFVVIRRKLVKSRFRKRSYNTPTDPQLVEVYRLQ